MVNKLVLAIFVGIFIFVSFLVNGYALPVYKNYNDTDILSTKFKLGTLIGKTEAKDLNLVTNEKGLTALFEINPLYNISYFNKFYVGVAVNSFVNEDFRTNAALLNFSYYFPIVPCSLDLLAGVNLYIASGFGVRYIHGNNNEEFSCIGKQSSIKSLALGAEIYPKLLKDYKIAFYLEFRNIYCDYNIIINNIKDSKNYKNSFVTIGFLYKTNYLIKCE